RKIISQDSLSGSFFGLIEDKDDAEVMVVYSASDSLVFKNVVTGQDFKIAGVFEEELMPQYYNISGHKQYVLNLKDQGKSIIYNGEDEQNIGVTIGSTQEISMLYSSLKNIYRVYLVNENKLQLVEF
ncbi:MAG: hypothetical protein MK212_21890, partial [Saprospiraceae bacterium]|nr:hypothetical protein [Saprospiraceae bacterium]